MMVTKKKAKKPPAPTRDESVAELVDRFEDAIFHSKLPCRARLLFLAMLHYATPAPGGNFHSDARYTDVARWMGCSARTVIRELAVLRREGWIGTVDDVDELRIPGGG